MGSQRMMKYGIVGDTVNVAARLEQLNNRIGSLVLLSQEVHDALSTELRSQTRNEGGMQRGRNQKQRVYSVGPIMPDEVASMNSADFSMTADDFMS